MRFSAINVRVRKTVMIIRRSSTGPMRRNGRSASEIRYQEDSERPTSDGVLCSEMRLGHLC
jgi:hypothetical protein